MFDLDATRTAIRAMTHAHRKTATVVKLGVSQTLSWASSYYLPALLAQPMAQSLGISTPAAFAAFSFALVVSAMVGPWAGGVIDRLGGRPVLLATNLLFALGLVLLGNAQGLPTLILAWGVIGVAMGCGLYEAAFATLVRLYGMESRGAITGITLIAGFASTVGWPVTSLLEVHLGWRGACFAWAALHLVLGLPLNASLPRVAPRAAAATTAQGEAMHAAAAPCAVRHPARATALLAFVFAATWFTTTAMASHLPRLLQATGASLALAVALSALVGPSQVVARLVEFGLMHRVHPLLSARLAALAHPLGVLILMSAGAPAALAFVLLHGAGNGILTIAKGTLPLAIFGAGGYGSRQGWLAFPSRFAQASAPFAFGLAIDRWGAGALWVTAALGVLACIALLLLHTGSGVQQAVSQNDSQSEPAS
jgi:predicted MFS family arabinose efflux permease